MKKFFLLVVFLPVVSYASFDYNGFKVDRFRVYSWLSEGRPTTSSLSPTYYPNSLDEAYSYFASGKFGFAVSLTGSTTSRSPSVPSYNNLYDFSITSASRVNITNSFFCTSNGVSFASSVFAFPRIASLYTSACSLFVSGYRGSGVQWFGNSSRYYVNVDYPVLLSDVLSSTNSVYRQILLSSLSDINDGVISIDSNLSDVSFKLDSIGVINNGILTNSQLSSFSLRSIDEDIDTLIDRVGDVLNKVSSDPFVNDFTNAVNALLSSGKISQYQADSFLSGYSSLGSPTEKAVFALSLKESVNSEQSAKDFIFTISSSGLSGQLLSIGQSLSADVVDALIGDYYIPQSRDSKKGGGDRAVSTRTSIKSELQKWKDDLKQQLQDWKTSDETGYLNVRSRLDNVVTNQVRYWDRDSPDSSINYGVHNLTNSLNTAVSSLSDSISNSFTNLLDTLSDPDRPLSVRLDFPLRYRSTEEVNVHDQEVVDAIRNGYINIEELKSAILEALNTSDPSVRVKGTNEVDWTPWFQKWDPYSSVVTNYYTEYNSSDPVAGLAFQFLSNGFDIDIYNGLPWFSRVEVLLAMIADISSSNAVEVADIQDELSTISDNFTYLGANVRTSSESFVDLFDYFSRIANRIEEVFGEQGAPVTDSGITLLSAGHWIGNQPLVLKIDTTVQNVVRLFFRCFWLLSALVVLWLLVSWSWQKVVAVLRWLWSMFDL